MMSYLHTKFHDNWITSFRGVAITRFWDGQTDGVTALLDQLSPLATQVKMKCRFISPELKAQVSFSDRLSSVNISHFHHFLQNHWATNLLSSQGEKSKK